MNRYLIPVVLLCVYLPVAAQHSLDVFTLTGLYGLPSSYEAPLAGKATETGLSANLKVPVVLSDKLIWYNDLTYSFYNISTDLSPEPSGMLTAMKLQGIFLQTGLVIRSTETTGWQFLFVPRHMSDFSNGTETTWQFGGIALYEKKYHDRLTMRFGALYNGEFFGPLAMPLVYLDWTLNDRWSIIGLLPIYARVNYKASDRLTTGFSHFGLVQTYRIGETGFDGDYIERASIDLTWFSRWKMKGNVYLETRLGYAVGRHYLQYASDQKADFRLSIIGFGDDRVAKNTAFSPGPIAQLRVVYNIPLD